MLSRVCILTLLLSAGLVVADTKPRAARGKKYALLIGVTESVLQGALQYWRNVDKDISDRIENGVHAG